MAAIFVTTLLAIGYSQPQQPCVFTAQGPYQKEPYVFNLTQISMWTLEKELPDHFYYYTPCRNGLRCQQGNANFYTNVMQMKQGQNQCTHYLSVDHHEQARYSFIGNSWHFSYADGQLCDATQQPRTINIHYHCNDVNNQMPAEIESVSEPYFCDYYMSLKSTLACVPENKYNANCQWKEQDSSGKYHQLDLSLLKGEVIHAPANSGYEFYYSVCSNQLHCWQQQESQSMAVLDNRQTDTCDHNLAVWEEGNAHPIIREGSNPPHWSFHFWNGDKCSDGVQGEFRVRWFCDKEVETYKVLDQGAQGDCDFFLNISTQYACYDQEPIWVDAKQAFGLFSV